MAYRASRRAGKSVLEANKLIVLLREQQRTLAIDTLTNPPSDYSKFMSAVGRYRGIDDAIEQIRRTIREDEDG